MMTTTTPRHVVVIGAGFAGLAAASTLRRTAPSISVTVLEAGSRVGGRALTVEVGTIRFGHLGPHTDSRPHTTTTTTSAPAPQDPAMGALSLGCTWFHGVRGHPLYELALRAGLLDDDVRLDPARMGAQPRWQVCGACVWGGGGRDGIGQLGVHVWHVWRYEGEGVPLMTPPCGCVRTVQRCWCPLPSTRAAASVRPPLPLIYLFPALTPSPPKTPTPRLRPGRAAGAAAAGGAGGPRPGDCAGRLRRLWRGG
jgi:hypothetical protein